MPSQTPDALVTVAKAVLVTPSSDGKDWVSDPASGGFNILARTKAGVSDRVAEATLDASFATIVRTTLSTHAGDVIPALVLRDGSRGVFAQGQVFATPITVLMMFLGLVLLLACANIATRIMRQLIVESLLLAALGGVFGLTLAYLGRNAISGFTPHFDWQVFGYTALITLAFSRRRRSGGSDHRTADPPLLNIT